MGAAQSLKVRMNLKNRYGYEGDTLPSMGSSLHSDIQLNVVNGDEDWMHLESPSMSCHRSLVRGNNNWNNYCTLWDLILKKVERNVQIVSVNIYLYVMYSVSY